MGADAVRLVFRAARPADVGAVVELVQSAYRGESSRAGWTTEADLLDGARTDAAEVEAVIADSRSLLLLAGLPTSRPDSNGADAPTVTGPGTSRPEQDAAGRVTSRAERDAGALTLAGGPPPGSEGDVGAGPIVACCHLRDDGGRYYFGLFAVPPGLQGGGIGRAMLAEAERVAVAGQARAMWMTVISQRLDLIAWYERLGFRLTGETEPFPYGDEHFGRPKRPDLTFAVLEKSLV